MPDMIEKLKTLESAATTRPWTEGSYGVYVPSYPWDRLVIFETNDGHTPIHSEEHRANLVLCEALRNLAPEMIALWSAAVEMDVEGGEILHSAGFWDALDALNTKAEEVLK